MIKSLKLYARYFSNSLFIGQARKFLIHDLKRYTYNRRFFENPHKADEELKQKALRDAINWLLKAQDFTPDGGMGCYHLVNGWSSSYPETSGYIIPTLIEYFHIEKDERSLTLAMRTADWLLSIQKQSGGWQGGKIAENKPEVVFNTAQIIRGMIAVYHEENHVKYLDAAIRAGDWLCDIQHSEGYWKKHALMDRPRVYDSYTDTPLLMLWEITKNDQYKNAAIRNLEWIVEHKQNENGWFEDCDNTIKRNDKPILHTIAYTIDGLLNSGQILKEEKYIAAARKSADVLIDIFAKKEYLNGRFDRQWNGTEYMMTTGWAQTAIIWLDLFGITKEEKYLDGACKLTDFLTGIQQRSFTESDNTRGAMPGSVPVWGKYEPFSFPNWATKYFADALMKELKLEPDID
ncbi:MAG: hypothetical protein K9G67_04145 [Bacteroidales bacterium]|nr:hypothetical protein [Bacteroidales bacterium]MCF8344276.1 hypothetical protein [Bacteroidales bacterium]MCF8351654.1 hypothetical protein [Bacteroidales bacterium]MCF8375523.1 hypothetical protein [Bacteroidales bacterium]MCF8399922.1 hypothetical protein [Bacteroidales bacterium]